MSKPVPAKLGGIIELVKGKFINVDIKLIALYVKHRRQVSCNISEPSVEKVLNIWEKVHRNQDDRILHKFLLDIVDVNENSALISARVTPRSMSIITDSSLGCLCMTSITFSFQTEGNASFVVAALRSYKRTQFTHRGTNTNKISTLPHSLQSP